MSTTQPNTIVTHTNEVCYTVLKHPWSYHFYVDRRNISSFKDERLATYLNEMLRACPHNHFLEGPRSSALTFDPKVTVIPVKHHHIAQLAKQGLEWGMQGTAHGNVQLYMLKNDTGTISVEVPLWLEEDEVKELELPLQTEKEGSLSGHIDILRIENGELWVWDYKPKAHREKHATSQVITYAIMLSYRTGIPLTQFKCGYFDDTNTYVFDPTTSPLAKQLLEKQVNNQ